MCSDNCLIRAKTASGQLFSAGIAIYEIRLQLRAAIWAEAVFFAISLPPCFVFGMAVGAKALVQRVGFLTVIGDVINRVTIFSGCIFEVIYCIENRNGDKDDAEQGKGAGSH